MSNRAIVLWSLALALPLQYGLFLGSVLVELVSTGVTHNVGAGSFGCPNFHEAGLWSCSFDDMLLSPIWTLILVNGLGFGIPVVVTAAFVGGLLLAWRRWHRGKSRHGAF